MCVDTSELTFASGRVTRSLTFSAKATHSAAGGCVPMQLLKLRLGPADERAGLVGVARTYSRSRSMISIMRDDSVARTA